MLGLHGHGILPESILCCREIEAEEDVLRLDLHAINKRDRRIWKGAALQLKAASEEMESNSPSEVKQAGECRNVVLLFLNC